MSEQPAPVSADARIVQLDVLRGLAILGVLAVNAAIFAYPFELMSVPDASPLPFGEDSLRVWLVMRTVFEAKFITLFTLLFGVSIYLVGGERHDPARGPVLRRRLGWLALFGLIHGTLIWFGDILLMYALCGFIMLLCRSWSARRLAVVGGVLFALATLLVLGAGAALQVAPEEIQAQALSRFEPAAIARSIDAFQGDWLQSQRANFREWASVAPAVIPVFGPRTLGLMMIGLALFKAGVLQGRSSTGLYVAMALAGAAGLGVVGWQAVNEAARGFPPVEATGTSMAANWLLSPIITLGYVAMISLALRGRLLRRPALALAPVGRMAFSNYIAQSLIMTGVFYGGRGLGLYGQVGWPQLALIVLAVWILQLIWSRLWLSRFTMGPLEWVWRRLSYRRDIPLRRARGATTAGG